MRHLGHGRYVRGCQVPDEELLPWGRIVTTKEEVVQDAPRELGRLLERRIANTWDVVSPIRRKHVKETQQAESPEILTNIEKERWHRERGRRRRIRAPLDARSSRAVLRNCWRHCGSWSGPRNSTSGARFLRS